MRELTKEGFGKKNRDWNRKELLEEQRKAWETYTNRALEKAGHSQRIDHRTLEAQGLNRLPQIHLGADVAAMMERGIPTERGEVYLRISNANKRIEALERKITATEETIETQEQSTQKKDSEKMGAPPTAGEVDSSPQIAETATDSLFEPELTLTEESATELSDERNKRISAIRTELGVGLDQIIDSLTRSNQQAQELVERLKKTSEQAREVKQDSTETSQLSATHFQDGSDSNREAESPRNRTTNPNLAAEDLTREFQRLEERINGSDRKNRKAGKSAAKGLGAIAALLGKKIKQLARDILSASENTETRQARSSQLARESSLHQANRTTQEDLGYSTGYQPSDQRTQQTPQATPLLPTLSQDEVMKIAHTATEAIKRYGKGLSNEKTFSNAYYQISLQAIFETYGWRHYLTVTANDGRGKILVLKGQNSNPSHMDVKENRLSQQDVNTFEKIQTALDYYQQIRQLKQDAQTILRRIGVPDPLHPLKGYGTFEGEKYRIVSEEMAFRIIAHDGRGEILNYPNDPYAPHPEARAKTNFNPSDVELFRTVANQIEQEQRDSERQWQKQREIQRQSGEELEP